MTLIISYVNNFYAVQVSDRKVVLAERDLPEYDATANKTVVYGATNGLVSISFAGHAYLDGMPTDEWITTFLWGQSIHRGPDGQRPALHHIGQSQNQWDVNDTLLRLKDHMDGALRRNQGLELSICGWRVDETGPLSPVLSFFENSAGNDHTEARDIIGYRDLNTYFSVCATIGVGEKLEDASRAWEGFRERGYPPSMEEAEATLVSVVRSASQDHGGIGEHVLAVCIPRFDLGAPYSRFHPNSQHRRRATIRGVDVEAEVAFVPWIVSPNLVTAQSYQTNDLIIPFGNLEFTAHGTGAAGLGFGFASTNPRPPPA